MKGGQAVPPYAGTEVRFCCDWVMASYGSGALVDSSKQGGSVFASRKSRSNAAEMGQPMAGRKVEKLR